MALKFVIPPQLLTQANVLHQRIKQHFPRRLEIVKCFLNSVLELIVGTKVLARREFQLFTELDSVFTIIVHGRHILQVCDPYKLDIFAFLMFVCVVFWVLPIVIRNLGVAWRSGPLGCLTLAYSCSGRSQVAVPYWVTRTTHASIMHFLIKN